MQKTIVSIVIVLVAGCNAGGQESNKTPTMPEPTRAESSPFGPVESFSGWPEVLKDDATPALWEVFLQSVETRPNAKEDSCPMGVTTLASLQLLNRLEEPEFTTLVKQSDWAQSSSQLLRLSETIFRFKEGREEVAEELLEYLKSEDDCVRRFALEPLKSWLLDEIRAAGVGRQISDLPSLKGAIRQTPRQFGIPGVGNIDKLLIWRDFALVEGENGPRAAVLWVRSSVNNSESSETIWKEVGVLEMAP